MLLHSLKMFSPMAWNWSSGNFDWCKYLRGYQGSFKILLTWWFEPFTSREAWRQYCFFCLLSQCTDNSSQMSISFMILSLTWWSSNQCYLVIHILCYNSFVCIICIQSSSFYDFPYFWIWLANFGQDFIPFCSCFWMILRTFLF